APANRVKDVFVYPGTVEHALAGKPTTPRSWAILGPVMLSHPIIAVAGLYDNTFNLLQQQHPGWVIAPGLAVVRGPHPAAPLSTPRFVPPSHGSLYGSAVLLLVLLFVAGLG